MLLTSFQEFMHNERWNVINKFQETFKTKEEKERALELMDDKDILFLIIVQVIYMLIFFILSF